LRQSIRELDGAARRRALRKMARSPGTAIGDLRRWVSMARTRAQRASKRELRRRLPGHPGKPDPLHLRRLTLAAAGLLLAGCAMPAPPKRTTLARERGLACDPPDEER
jgi:hypothetical protein